MRMLPLWGKSKSKGYRRKTVNIGTQTGKFKKIFWPRIARMYNLPLQKVVEAYSQNAFEWKLEVRKRKC